jgi:RNA polymerase sigma-70 factor (ECF subfamily)
MRMPSLTAVSPDFAETTEPFRRELVAHCYRLLGSIDDAEDLVQETYLRAWRSYEEFEGRSSVRTWLYRIATNVCLSALEQRRRRVLPSTVDGEQDPAWLQPIPDAWVEDPASVVASRESLRLALIASLQYLPPRQRAVLLLREVLAMPANDVARVLETSVAAVKSTLQRARARLDAVGPDADRVAEPTEPQRRALLDAYMTAFETSDAAGLERLLRTDAALEVVPSRDWSAGRQACLRVIRASLGQAGEWRMVPTGANGQPAAIAYRNGKPFGVAVLTTTATHITRIVVFAEPGLCDAFG